MRRKTLKEIMQNAAEPDEAQIDQIMAELYMVPVSQLYKQDYRASSKQNMNILDDLKIPRSCAEILTFGEIACLIEACYAKKENVGQSNRVIGRLAQLGYWY